MLVLLVALAVLKAVFLPPDRYVGFGAGGSDTGAGYQCKQRVKGIMASENMTPQEYIDKSSE